MPESLSVGVVAGVAPDRWVRAWHERMPAAALRVTGVADPVAALADGLDVVFARLPVAAEDVHVIPLWEETTVVVAARDHPVKAFDSLTLADLADEDVREGWDEPLLDVVAAGHALARMPQSVFRGTGRRDLVARPITDAPPTRVGLVWRRTADGPLIQAFIGIVRGRTANTSRGPNPPPAPPVARRRPRPRRHP